jgi:hypothetical protein
MGTKQPANNRPFGFAFAAVLAGENSQPQTSHFGGAPENGRMALQFPQDRFIYRANIIRRTTSATR